MPPIFDSHSLDKYNKLLKKDTVEPSPIKTKLKPDTNNKPCNRVIDRLEWDGFALSAKDRPPKYPINAGSKGRIQGERNDARPATKAKPRETVNWSYPSVTFTTVPPGMDTVRSPG